MVSPSAVSRETEGLDEPRLLLAESVSGMAAKFPDVHVEQVLARGEARQCLSADSSTWHLVVVGRHPVDSLARRLSAPVATAVVERSRTTVLVVPQAEPTSES
jgi:nucleotide-binding universal stress UspA family protein